MARKKKVEFIPSKYQQAIYDYIEHETGNLVVEAAAGAGKTTTLVNCLKLVPPEMKVLMCAFNKDIVAELAKKTKGIENVEVRTLHGLGGGDILFDGDVRHAVIEYFLLGFLALPGLHGKGFRRADARAHAAAGAVHRGYGYDEFIIGLEDGFRGVLGDSRSGGGLVSVKSERP